MQELINFCYRILTMKVTYLGFTFSLWNVLVFLVLGLLLFKFIYEVFD